MKTPPPTPIFATPAAGPELAWKTNPQVGHLQGSITNEAGQPIDGAQVAIAPASSDPAPATGPA
jgi:hypothetical protein